jgi:DNA replication protein DnaC
MRHTMVLFAALLSSPAIAQVSINEIRTGTGNDNARVYFGDPGRGKSFLACAMSKTDIACRTSAL